LNKKLKELGSQGFTAGGNLKLDAVDVITGGALHYNKIPASESEQVDAELCAGRPVILEVGGHFVVATGKKDGKYIVNNPGSIQGMSPVTAFVTARVIAP
jgi:hypothetical protein